MNSHKNASLTPRGRAHLVKNVATQGCKLAAEAAGVSRRTAARWHRRHALEGPTGLLDRSSRP
ncbi:MAG: leucine zipper domain-containing protein, partial [Roseateles sp.]